MLRIFRLILRLGCATTGYPDTVEPPPPAFRGRPALDAGRCDGSADCVAVCPSMALSLDASLADGRRPWRLDLSRCVFCGLCAEVCPTEAITMTSDFELAARRREDLLVTVLPDHVAAAAGEGRSSV